MCLPPGAGALLAWAVPGLHAPQLLGVHSRLQHSIKSPPCALGLVGWETASREMPFKARQHAGIAMAVLGGRRGYEPHPRYCRDCLGPWPVSISISFY